MADTKISGLADGSPLQATDDIPVRRGSGNPRVRIDLSAYVAKTEIDTLAELNALIADATLIDTNDSRLSNARTPTAHAASHATGGSDALTPAAIGAATSAQGALADTAVQPARTLSAGTGLEGGGDLSADRSFALTAAAIASLALADTATQPGDDADTLGSGAATDGQVLTADGIGGAAWEDAAAGGGTPGGSDGQVQFNASGSFSADAGLAYNSTTRALTVGGATVTASSPVLDLAQTWNEGATTFTALRLAVTDTASAAASLLMDLRVGAGSVASVTKAGLLTATDLEIGDANKTVVTANLSSGTIKRTDFRSRNSSAVCARIGFLGSAFPEGGLSLHNSASLGWAVSNPGANVLSLWKDDAHILAQYLDTNPQTYRLYNTRTDASNYERLSIGWSANVCTIGTEAAGTGTQRNIVLDGANRAAYSETAADIAAALVAHGIMAPA